MDSSSENAKDSPAEIDIDSPPDSPKDILLENLTDIPTEITPQIPSIQVPLLSPELKADEPISAKKKPPTLFSIRRVIESESSPQSPHHQQLSCIVCHIKHNEIRDFAKVIVICIEEPNEYYCDVCLTEQLEREMGQAKKLEESFIYHKEFETSMSQSDKRVFLTVNRDENQQATHLEVEQLQAEEMALDRTIQEHKEECMELQIKVHALQQKEEKFWSDLNKFEKRASKLEQKAYIAKTQKENERVTMEELSKSSIIHAFFQIEIEDSFAKVCGLTVGKKPDQIDVNWDDTNSALGHILLAYNYLSMKYGIPYTRFECIRIKGHLSEVQLKNSQIFQPISYNGRESERAFGAIMEKMLAELWDLSQQIQEVQNIEYTEQLKLPFQISKDEGKIVELSVNPSKIEDKGKWNHWTKAMRYFLIDLKHILTISLLSDPYL